jgi:hypothetical protein
MIFIRLKVWDRAVGIFLMLLSIFIYVHTYSFDYPRGGGAMVNIALFPRFLAVPLFVLGLLLLFKRQTTEDEKTSITKEKKLVALYIGLVLYTYLLDKLGFLADTFLWVAYVGLLVGERKWWVILLTALLGPALGYYVFQVQLGVPLPEGSLLRILGLM